MSFTGIAQGTALTGTVNGVSFSTTQPKTRSKQQASWSDGRNYYALRVDGNNRVICDPGSNHRKVYVSNSTGMDAAAVATDAGVSVATAIDPYWLGDNLAAQIYGATPAYAVTEEVAAPLWSRIADGKTASHHLLFNRGDVFSTVVPIQKEMKGESPYNPILIGAYGTGAKPIITAGDFIHQSQWIVWQDIETTRMRALNCTGLLLDHCNFSSAENEFQYRSHLTCRECKLLDIFATVPSAGAGNDWDAFGDRESGFYFGENAVGILFEDTLFDVCGWATDYDPTTMNSDLTTHPPSLFSHGLYIQRDCFDVTAVGCVISRAASNGAQFRPGGFISDNVFLENNIGFNIAGGDEFSRHYALVHRNLVVGAGGKVSADEQQGATAWGAAVVANSENADESSVVDNIVIHAADPNDPSDAAGKELGGADALFHDPVNDVLTDNSIVYNWASDTDRNDGGVSAGVKDATTYQNWANTEFSTTGSNIASVMAQFRAVDEITSLRDSLQQYFWDVFSISYSARSVAQTCAFLKDYRGEGYRWDNPLNWDTGDIPGVDVLGDTVSQSKGKLVFCRHTATLGAVNADDLLVSSGCLTATSITATKTTVDMSGMLSFDGTLNGDVFVGGQSGGRIQNTGDWTPTGDVTIYEGQAVLAEPGGSMTLASGRTMNIHGGQAGFDGSGGGSASLTVEGTLAFKTVVSVSYDTGPQNWAELIKQGATVTGSTSGATGTFVSQSTNTDGISGTIRLVDVTGTFVDGEELTESLRRDNGVAASQPLVNGTPTVSIGQINEIQTGIYGETPNVASAVTLASGSTVTVDTSGLATGTYDLIDVDTLTDNGATLPSGVSVVGNRLQLTVS